MGEILEIDAVTVPWLDSALAGYFRRTHVESFTAAPLGHNEGFIASLYLLTMKLDNEYVANKLHTDRIPSLANDQCTESQVVAKFATNAEEGMNEFLFTTHRFHERECICYGDIFPELRLREVPIRYFQECDPKSGRGVILMEHLHNTITPRLFPDGLSVAQTEAAVRVLAKLHAATEQSKADTWGEDLSMQHEGEAIGRLRALGGFSDLLSAVYVDGLDTLTHYHAPVLAEEHPKFGTIGRGAQVLGERLVEVKKQVAAMRPLESVCHGDIWCANVLFDQSKSDKLVAIVDWQCAVIGPALNDVAFLLISSLSSDARRSHTDAILETYCKALSEHGVAGIDMAQVKAQYTANVPLAVAQAIGCPAWWTLYPDTPAEVKAEMINRLRYMLHEALDLI